MCRECNRGLLHVSLKFSKINPFHLLQMGSNASFCVMPRRNASPNLIREMGNKIFTRAFFDV